MNNIYLAHYGIQGMKWGVRRYQDSDGNLTEAGRKRYSGKYGVGKYLYDNDPRAQFNSRRAGRGIAVAAGLLTAGASKGDRISYALNGQVHTTYTGLGKYGKAGAIGQIAVGVLTMAATQAAASYVNRNMRYQTLEYVEASDRELREARKYLRSQGIDV